MTRAEFWSTSPQEALWLIDHQADIIDNTPQEKYNGMTEADVRELYNRNYGGV